ncbi:unnamed protein product [Gongylonema pulchrum]|uniref:Ephrin_rec_like domain-containing protein n=1 Tax=Gongylonema pulchrum TaxID=637853 RepID=A0A183DYT6_9BILA|nr:unnamed protein product [Gongylonema pulchrum]
MVEDGTGVPRLVSLSSCPGFCGRQAFTWSPGNITYSDCQACNWGYRSIDKLLCSSCVDLLPLYDWLYLIFPFSIRQHLFLQHLSCLLECVVSALFTVLIMPPRGSPLLYGCAKSSLREWYPIFYNPVVNHSHTMRCAQEIVFPLLREYWLAYESSNHLQMTVFGKENTNIFGIKIFINLSRKAAEDSH